MKPIGFLLLILLSFVSAIGQVLAPPVEETRISRMEITSTVPTDVEAKTMLAGSRCDGAGTLYVPLQNVAAKSGWNQLLVLNRRGEAKTFTINQPTDLLPTRFFVSDDGFVYVLAQETKRPDKLERWVPDVYLLRYDRNGQYDSKVKLDATFAPRGSFVVFPSGEVLVSAIEALKPGASDGPRPSFMALFDSNGQFVKRVSAENDQTIEKSIRESDGSVIPGKGANSAIETGIALLGSDGNAYVMRKTSPAIVYVIASDGRIIRTLKLSSGEPKLFPAEMFESDRQIAILFANYGPGERRMKVFDSLSGQELKVGAVENPLGVALACFKAPTFSFLRIVDGKFVVYSAELK